MLHAIGWDAFGLPAENAAIQHGEPPRRWTERNIETMRGQLQRLGLSYDWQREVTTCDPAYYRWNQWFFLRMLERGIAYRARRFLNWCEGCLTVLANEQVHAGRCWRCGSRVSRRDFEQWFLRITDYAESLLEDLDRLEGWPEKVRTMQWNWIGRSEGARVLFPIEGSNEAIEVFTTRLDTIYGATAIALALEHPAAERLVRGTPAEAEVLGFVRSELARSLEDRFADAARKAGAPTGRYCINPFSGERIPVWVVNFVLAEVGTGAIMSVPALDERDFAFAREHRLPIRPVVRPPDAPPFHGESLQGAFTEEGVLHDSGPYSGLASAEARRQMLADAAARGFGSAQVTYRLKDWGISRQRYWGTPIPALHCGRCGIVPVPEEELPVLLPDEAPLTGAGGSPLARVPGFVRARCPSCGGEASRDTDTMDTFVDSCWYYFRYADPANGNAPFDWQQVRPWFPVDLYIGGIEHATMHLIYTRFWTKVMRDLELVDLDEPVRGLFTQGMVIKDGAKMSKSRGNVVDPDDMIERYGADTTRLFSLFAAPPERDLEWSEAGVEGCFRFLSRVWRLFERVREKLPPHGAPPPERPWPQEAVALRKKTHRTIQRVTEDLGPRMHLNTAVAAVMELSNTLAPLAERGELEPTTAWAVREALEALAKLLSPMAPHVAEELWEGLGGASLVASESWPEPDAALLEEESVTVVVQVDGRLRGQLVLPRGSAEQDAVEAARRDRKVAAHLDGKSIQRVVYVPDRLLNLVTR